jgi:hypothetical protein
MKGSGGPRQRIFNVLQGSSHSQLITPVFRLKGRFSVRWPPETS